MLAICIESSHERGMGHFFRMLRMADWLRAHGESFLVALNADEVSCALLRERALPFETVPLKDDRSGWEVDLIRRYGVTVWLDDRMETTVEHASLVKRAGVKLCTIDDAGGGAALADVHFCPMLLEPGTEKRGACVRDGLEYLILDPALATLRGERTEGGRILVTLGGSDTYGVTVRVARWLSELELPAVLAVGPAFAHDAALKCVLNDRLEVRRSVPSLPSLFPEFDMAVTGGGVTPFEACASGLPCLVIANEPHEVWVGKKLEAMGCAVFAGAHGALDGAGFRAALARMDIPGMSRRGMERIPLDGLETVLKEVLA